MRSAICLLVVTFFLQDTSCVDDFLAKFHQNRYKVKDFRVQLMSYDENYVNFMEVKRFKFNRTTTAHNTTLNMKVNLDDKVEILLQGYKFLSNEYRRIAIRFQVNLQKAFDANLIGIKGITKCGNFTNFIFYKDITYHLCNFVIDETQMPPLIPNGMYKAEMQYLFLEHAIATLHSFFEIYTPIYPKK